MKKKLLVILLAMNTFFSVFFLKSAYCEPDAETSPEANAEESEKNIEGLGTENKEDVSLDNSAEIITTENFMDEIIGDELAENIMWYDTKYSVETPIQISGNFDIPTGFNHAAYVQFMSVDTGEIYEIQASDENDYVDYCFVPYGTYSVLGCGIVGDLKSQYPLSVLNELNFSVDENVQTHSITIQMDDYHEIAEQIAQRNGTGNVQIQKYAGSNYSITSPQGSGITEYPTYFSNIKYGSDNKPYFSVKSSRSDINVLCSGYAKRDYDLFIEIVEGGCFEEAKMAVYPDGKSGECAGTDYISEDYSLSSFGLNFYFETAEDYIFEVGDTFEVQVKKFEPFIPENTKGSNMLAVLDKTTIKDDFVLRLSVISNGARGSAKLSIVKNNDDDNRTIVTIGEDGVVTYEGFTFYFSASDFVKNSSWNLDYEYSSDTVNYFPLFVLIAIAAITVVALYLFLMSQKEDLAEYRIVSWTDQQDSDKYA